MHVSVEINSEHSPVRLKNGAGQDFVMSLAAGVNPNKYELFPMEVQKGKRSTILATAKMVTSESTKTTLAVEVKRYGQGSYKLSPAQKLPAGEYCLSPSDSNENFCWGIDPK
jgi:hypothetical protein